MDSRNEAFMKKWMITLGLWAGLSVGSAAQYRSEVWTADCGNGFYRNPIIHADYSDPDVCAVGNDYYMTASSFQCTPGLPILHSNDLVNWKIVNYALKELVPGSYYNVPRHGKGVWAPSIRYHNGRYYIYWGDPDFGIYMVKTDNPLGEWEKPVLVKAGKGMIDPTPLWDDDGKVYLVHAWASSRAKLNSILTVCELNAEGTSVISSPVLVYDGNDRTNHTLEGPKLYKRDGYYYILAPAGGVVNGWQLALRSKSIYGPYESKIVMSQGDSPINGPHQGAWVDTPFGESWFIHFQDKGLYGRVVHLNPMEWVDGWPVIGEDKDGDGCGTPILQGKKPKTDGVYSVASPQESDEFNTHIWGLQWEWHANYQDVFGFPSEMGYARIYSHILSEDFRNFWEVPNLLLQKFPAEAFTVTAKLKVSAKANGQTSGLIIMGEDYCRIGLEKQEDHFLLKQILCHDAEAGGKEEETQVTALCPTRVYEAGVLPNAELEIYLRVKVTVGGKCRFAYSLDGKKFSAIPHTFQARQGKWIGAKVGLFSVAPYGAERGWLDVDWFHVAK